MATLKEAKIGSTVTVKKLNGTGAVTVSYTHLTLPTIA